MAKDDAGDRPGCLITRPEPGTAATAARVAVLGWEPVLAPALLLSSLPMEPAPEARVVLVPSAAVLPSLAAVCPPDLPVLAVGEGTGAAARAAGFTDVIAAEGDAASLIVLAAARLDRDGPLLLPSGQGYGDELAAGLEAHGFRVIRREAYVATEAASLPEAAIQALAVGRIRVALFFSPRTARATISLMRGAGLYGAATRIRALALSSRVAEALSGASGDIAWGGLDVAPRPDQDALLGLLGPPPALALPTRPEG
ncbi:uroporphyrinogen-III synthase [Roseomonas xinghualingensis]|uniref:uroporphyrinogen-III synthase n=1 Tax=Roseomonas xinghualingensis TaxID=2986475 RepID=UPI0021F0EB1D|nr:uroporphyrinogen-III synthase [Roseomonas sp. SXEYE001]MCV4207609.1 uroporphyrinogen-III synthase [Roseomonas sp. SXEYE001]